MNTHDHHDHHDHHHNSRDNHEISSDATWAPPSVRPATPQAPASSRRRTGLIAGVSAGLLGGAAAGLIFAMPGSTSATSTDASDSAVAAAVAQVDTEDSTVEPGSGEIDADRLADRTEKMRTELDELVTDGTITAAQADAVAAHLAENAPERGGRGPGHHGPGGRFLEGSGVITDLLGVDRETLAGELQGGATLSEVAEANGVSTDELVDALVAEATERLESAVENGRIDQAEADERAADLEERITERVTTARPTRN